MPGCALPTQATLAETHISRLEFSMKISDFKPSALRLYTLLGHEDQINSGVQVRDEYLDIAYCATEIENQIYREIGPEADKDTTQAWPIEPQIADAFRACMREYPRTCVSEDFSRLLLRCGFDDPEIIDALNWSDRMFFKWKNKGVTVNRVRSLLARAGLPDDISGNERAKLESWIERPISGAFDYGVIHTIFGRRVIGFNLRDDDLDNNANLFRKLFRGLDLESRITSARQCDDYDWGEGVDASYESFQKADGEAWQPFYDDRRILVTFLFGNSNYVFFVDSEPPLVNEQDVLSNFDAFMLLQGRKERAFRFNEYWGEWQEGGSFIVGEPQGLREMVGELEIEILSASPEAQSSVDFRLGDPPMPYGAQPTLHVCPAPENK
jgi:hypothetical protein